MVAGGYILIRPPAQGARFLPDGSFKLHSAMPKTRVFGRRFPLFLHEPLVFSLKRL
jgi:hypothetical protein